MRWLLAALLLAGCGSPEVTSPLNTDAVTNGGFEDGAIGWGTGYIEDSIHKYHAHPDEARLPLVLMPDVNASGGVVPEGRNGGRAYKLVHLTGFGRNKFSTLAQRVTVLPGESYGVQLWAHANASAGSWFVTTTREWEPHTTLPVARDWTWVEHRFNPGEADKVEIRFVVLGPGTYWLDDVKLMRYPRR